MTTPTSFSALAAFAGDAGEPRTARLSHDDPDPGRQPADARSLATMLIAQAKTGSGKTAAFALPLLREDRSAAVFRAGRSCVARRVNSPIR